MSGKGTSLTNKCEFERNYLNYIIHSNAANICLASHKNKRAVHEDVNPKYSYYECSAPKQQNIQPWISREANGRGKCSVMMIQDFCTFILSL